MTQSNHIPELSPVDDQTSRPSLKSGALAAGALAFGVGTSGSATAQRAVALVFAYDYYPGASLTVVAPLQPDTTIDLLTGEDGEELPVLSQPDDYNGYVVYHRLGNRPVYKYLFTRRNLRRGQQYRVSNEAQVFSNELNLLETRLRPGGSQNDGDG